MKSVFYIGFFLLFFNSTCWTKNSYDKFKKLSIKHKSVDPKDSVHLQHSLTWDEIGKAFTLLHKNILYYIKHFKIHFNVKENVVVYKKNPAGTITALQFYNNKHLFNIDAKNKLKDLKNKDEIIGDPYMIFYQLDENNDILSYHLILNNSSVLKTMTYFSKKLITKTIVINENYTVLLPTKALSIADLSIEKLNPYIVSYHNTTLLRKNQLAFQKYQAKESKLTLSNNQFSEIDEDNQINSYHDADYRTILTDDNNQPILDENNRTQYSSPLDSIVMPNEYLTFQYFIKFPKSNQTKIMYVYADLNLNVIKMELKTTFLSKNYYNKSLIKNWFLRTIKVGQPVDANVFLLNNIIIRNPFIQINMGVILEHHKFNQCQDKNNFFMAIVSFDTKQQVVTSIKKIDECCGKKPLNIM